MNRIPVTCSWARTPGVCAGGRCRSLWMASGAGSLLLTARLGWGVVHYLAAPRCHGPDALLCRGQGYRHLATGWGGVCRSKPVSVTSKLTVQIPLSTGWQREREIHSITHSTQCLLTSVSLGNINKMRRCRVKVNTTEERQRHTTVDDKLLTAVEGRQAANVEIYEC